MSRALAAEKAITLDRLISFSPLEAVRAVEAGFPAQLVQELGGRFKVTMEQLAELLRLTPRILQRRIESGTLGLPDSERVRELSALFDKAEDVLGSADGAAHWFQSRPFVLAGKRPLDLAGTSPGIHAPAPFRPDVRLLPSQKK